MNPILDPFARRARRRHLGFVPDSTHYFDFHHSARDRLEAVDRKELHAGAAALATLTYLLAENGR